MLTGKYSESFTALLCKLTFATPQKWNAYMLPLNSILQYGMPFFSNVTQWFQTTVSLTPDFTLTTPAQSVISSSFLKKDFHTLQMAFLIPDKQRCMFGNQPNCLQKWWEFQDKHLSSRKIFPFLLNHKWTSVKAYSP